MSGPEVKVQRATITPARAEQLLKLNTGNRSVSQQRIDQYAADIRKGDWQFNGEAIKIAHTGQVLDGQHRLMAVLEANKPIETLLITGLEPEAQETMDQGRARTLSDVLKLRGEAYYTGVAGAVRMVCIYERDGVPFVAAYKAAPTVGACLRTLERNPDIRDSVAFAYQHLRGTLAPVTVVAGLHYLFASVSEEDALDFWTKLLRGANLDVTDPVFVLRSRLAIDLRERALRPKEKLALIIKTWNAYQRGDQVTRLAWQGGGARPERFPTIYGLSDARRDATDEPVEEVAA